MTAETAPPVAPTQKRMAEGTRKVKQEVRQTKQTIREVKHDHVLRTDLQERVDCFFDLPLALTSILMVLVTLIQIAGVASPPWQGRLAILQLLLWGVFVLHYIVKFIIAPVKSNYVRRHWLDTLVVVVPFLGFLRILAVLQAAPILPLFRLVVFGSAGLSVPLAILRRRKLFQLSMISVLVILLAAGIELLLEKSAAGSQIHSFGDAVWWAASTATTIGSELYPVTTGGRVVSFLLMLFAIGVFSYFTASVASIFVGVDAASGTTQTNQERTSTLGQEDLSALHAMVRQAVAEALASPDVRKALAGPEPADAVQRKVNDILVDEGGPLETPAGTREGPATES